MGLFQKQKKENMVFVDVLCAGKAITKKELDSVQVCAIMMCNDDIGRQRFVKILTKYTKSKSHEDKIIEFGSKKDLYSFLEECNQYLPEPKK